MIYCGGAWISEGGGGKEGVSEGGRERGKERERRGGKGRREEEEGKRVKKRREGGIQYGYIGIRGEK